MRAGEIELIDEGVRVKKVVCKENYYLYIAPKALVITCPRENAPDMSREREAMEDMALTTTMVRGGEYE